MESQYRPQRLLGRQRADIRQSICQTIYGLLYKWFNSHFETNLYYHGLKKRFPLGVQHPYITKWFWSDLKPVYFISSEHRPLTKLLQSPLSLTRRSIYARINDWPVSTGHVCFLCRQLIIYISKGLWQSLDISYLSKASVSPKDSSYPHLSLFAGWQIWIASTVTPSKTLSVHSKTPET